MAENGIDLYIEIGCGKTLSGMNKKMKLADQTFSVDKITDLDHLIEYHKQNFS